MRVSVTGSSPVSGERVLGGVRVLLGLGAMLALFPATKALASPTVSAVAFGSVDNPVDVSNAGDTRIFVADQDGEIIVLDSTGASLGTFLDIQERVIAGGERGLLGIAFHPNYASNGFFYVNYTRDPDDSMSGEAGEGDTRVSRFSRIGGVASNVADATSEFPIIDVPQPFANHNAGDLAFGPDGYLWIPLGDGGAGCDPGDRAQDPNELLGKVLRIDVDSGSPYAIPPDNPFVGPGPPLDEIWASGLRNPFRFSFDRLTGDVWIADVGQLAWEEINFQPASSTGGENYGWDCREGLHPASDPPSNCSTTASCAGPFDDPVHEYDHGDGCAVIGGYVYRGTTYASLIGGHYFFSDACSGTIWSLSSPCGEQELTDFGIAFPGASSFGEGADGELYLTSLGTNTVYKIQAGGTPTACPAGCSATPLNPCRQPGAGKGFLLIKNDSSDDNKDKLIWKWLKGEETLKQAFGDPSPGEYTFCAYAGTAQNIVIEETIPSAASCPTCWDETGAGFKYKVPNGIQKVILKSGADGKAKIILKGKGSQLPDLPSIPVSEPILVQISNSDGECWEATYDNSTQNEGLLYKDKSD